MICSVCLSRHQMPELSLRYEHFFRQSVLRKSSSSTCTKCSKKEQGNWVKGTLVALEKNDTGWAKTINDILEQWGLETDWDKIEAKTKGE